MVTKNSDKLRYTVLTVCARGSGHPCHEGEKIYQKADDQILNIARAYAGSEIIDYNYLLGLSHKFLVE